MDYIFEAGKRRKGRVALQSLFVNVPAHPCSFIPWVSLGRRVVRRHKERKPQDEKPSGEEAS